MENHQDYYQVGGTLKIDNPSYITREADIILYEQLKNSEFCYVFNSRQIGKSSLQARVRYQLENEGFKCISISLTGIGRQVNIDEWYYSIVSRMVDDFGIKMDSLLKWWQELGLLSPLEKLNKFIKTQLLAKIKQNIIIFIDEIDTVLSLTFPIEDFFVFIRECYNERANNPNYNRLTFALFGVATPTQLIKDTRRTPFNIGYAIQLNPFSTKEASKLAVGLNIKVKNLDLAEYLIEEILIWTGGQPFLTQKICKSIVDYPDAIPSQKASLNRWLKELIQVNIIEPWENKNEPHLLNIFNRVNNSQEPLIKLLKLYISILKSGEIAATNTPEESDLILAGLIVKNYHNKLRVYNRIYALVFNSQWVAEMLKGKRPYGENLTGWIASEFKDKSYLLVGEMLDNGMRWSNENDSILTIEDYQFLKASQEIENTDLKSKLKKTRLIQKWSIPMALGLIIASGVIGGTQIYDIQSFFVPYHRKPEIFSEGEQTFFIGNGNSYQISGIKAFARGDYKSAIDKFKDSKVLDTNDPEVEIYYNNALARQAKEKVKKDYFTLAVAVPINARREMAREILRGVAQAQMNFNEKEGAYGRLLNVVVADDRNDIGQGRIVAEEFVKDKRVLGVIGHNGSSVTKEVLGIYQNANLPMISPTSTSTELKHSQYPVFFRTIPNDEQAGKKLAGSALNQNVRRVVIFNKENDTYSQSLTKAFENEFKAKGGQIIRKRDLGDTSFDTSYEVYLTVTSDRADAIVLFPNIEVAANAINIAKARSQQQIPQNFGKNLKMFGGDALYGADTLKFAKESLAGLTLAVPWFSDNQNFATTTCKRWGGAASWRTAAAYDATQAFIAAISESKGGISRQSILKKLNTIKLSSNETSGDELYFKDGEPPQQPQLVQVIFAKGSDCNGSNEAGFRFELKN